MTSQIPDCPYTVLESTTAESKTSLFSSFVRGIFFPGIEILTLHRLQIQFTTSCQIITQIRGSHGDTKFEAMQSIDLHCIQVWIWRKYQYLHISFIVFGYYLNDRHLSGHWIWLDTDRKIAEKSINCPQYFISRFPQTLKLTKYKIWKRTMGLQTGYFKNAA